MPNVKLELTKILVSALLISAITQISRKAPMFAGWISALPLISLISAAWLSFEGASNATLSSFLFGVVIGLLPTALLLSAVAICLRYGVSFALSLVVGLVLWGVVTFLRYGVSGQN
jgi:pilus assembly protein TadC